jgi:hypothetical protein
MYRTVAALIAGLFIGGGVAWYVSVALNEGAPEVVRDIVAVPKMSAVEGARHRQERFEQLLTVAQVQALPTRFMRAEALHALAGRSNSAEIQNLIFEANRVSDDGERENALTILFSRLTELDAHSALALIRSEYLSGSGLTERDIWIAYGQHDLDAALATAIEQAPADRNLAAQALFSANGFMGTPETERIEAELGIKPNRSNRANFLYQLADQSPAAAAAYVNTLEPRGTRREAVYWLANYLQWSNPAAAATVEALLADEWARSTFNSVVVEDAVRADPQAVLDQLVGGNRSNIDQRTISTALRSIASKDLDAAKMYYLQLGSEDDRRTLGNAIAEEIARNDFDEAMTWARANESADYPMLAMQLLQSLASTDPERALTESRAYPDSNWREMLVSNVIQSIARDDPRKALQLSADIPGSMERKGTQRQVLAQWANDDPEAAVNWILNQDEDVARELLREGSSIIRENTSAAIRILPLLDEETAQRWRYQITERLAGSRSPEEAMAFANRFQGEEDYEKLQSAVVMGIAHRDPDRAMALAAQLTDVRARDAAYAQIVGRTSGSNPADSLAVLNMISTEPYREMAASSIASEWTATDPEAARRWVESLQPGRMRDAAVTGYVVRLEHMGPEEQALIESIDDRETREQAKINRIYRVMRTDPQRASELLRDPDISEMYRRRISRSLDMQGY